DKISLNTAAPERPAVIGEAVERFGSQCIVVAIDARREPARPDEPPRWGVYTHGGRRPAGRDALDWAREAVALGAGEILLTSMDRDGPKGGYARDPPRQGPQTQPGRSDPVERRDPLLVALARQAVEKGRELRARSARPVRLRRLRRRHAPRSGPSGRCGLPHRAAHLLLHGAQGGRRTRSVPSPVDHARKARAQERGQREGPALGLVRCRRAGGRRPRGVAEEL